MKSKIPNIVTILVLTVLTSVMWISLNIYRAFTLKPSPVVPKDVSQPLSPNLDQKTIEEIQNRLFLSEDQIPITVTTSVPSPTASPQPTASSISSGSPSPTPTSTSSPVGGVIP